jgi:hypothetical protein
VAHLQSGAFGMAYLERDKQTGEQVAIKYIPRGATVRALGAREGVCALFSCGLYAEGRTHTGHRRQCRRAAALDAGQAHAAVEAGARRAFEARVLLGSTPLH